MTAGTEYDITHSCGHSEVSDLSDVPAGRRAGRVAWLEDRPCFNCFRKKSSRKVSQERRDEFAALHQEALEDQERSELPPLRGSDKQIPWAQTRGSGCSVRHTRNWCTLVR